MVKVQLIYNYGFSWYTLNNISVKGYAFDNNGNLYKEKDLVSFFQTVQNIDDFENLLLQLNGLFVVIVDKGDEVFAAVDPTRTFPLFYTLIGDDFYISDNAYTLKGIIGTDINNVSQDEFLYTGYVTGKETLLKNIFQIQSGEHLHFHRKLKTKEYINFTVTNHEIKSEGDLEAKLMTILENSVIRMANSVGDRTIVIPLSGGYDSRVIATLLKKNKFENVICFSYGVKDSVDAIISQEVAKRLGFKWIFVDYNNIDFNDKYLYSEEFTNYYKYAFNMVSVFLLQDFFAVRYLHDNNLIPHNSVIVPGHSGDFLVGNHLYPFDKGDFSLSNLRYQIIKRHFVLQAYLKNAKIEAKLLAGLKKGKLGYSILDNFNLKERQSKFIVNANRVYEFFGYEHRVPLWDGELVEFFRVLPFEKKLNSHLYFKVVAKIFEAFEVQIIPPDKHKSRTKRTLKEYIPMVFSYFFRLYLHNRRPINTKVGYFKFLNPMVEEFNFKSYNVNGVLSKWLVMKELNK